MSTRPIIFFIDGYDTWDDNKGSTYWLALKLGEFELARWEVGWNMLNDYYAEDREQFVAEKLRELFSGKQ